MKLKKIISEWNDQSFKGLSKRWGKPYNQEGTDFENNTGGNKTLSEGPMNDPALKSLRIKSKGELMPELSKWWEYDPDDVMRFIYWGKGQMPPADEKTRSQERANIVKQLHVKYPIPADAKGMVDPPEGFIGEATAKKYELGDMWSDDFDYVGMLKAGSQATYEDGIEYLQKLYDSFEDVNYHSENKHLGFAIEEIENPGPDVNQAMENIEEYLEDFNKACLETLKDITKGKM